MVMAGCPAGAQQSAEVEVDTGHPLHAVDRRIYGHHLEHFGRIIQGGLWAELLRNQKFYPIDPNRSQVAEPWRPEPDRSDVSFVIDRSETLDGISSQRISVFGKGERWRGISQSGFDILGGREYVAYAWIRSQPSSASVSFRLESRGGQVAAHGEATLTEGDFRRYEVHLRPDRDLRPAVFRIAFNTPGAQWIGAASLMPADNVDGVRRDVYELLTRLKPPIFRWPGGGYTDSYDWRKAIGPRDRRPPQDLLPFGQPLGYDNGMDPNDFGTVEFLELCRRLGAEPYISANFGSGSPEMAASWVEYCNGPASSAWGRRRAENGHAEPWGVHSWSIGNEIWAPFEPGFTNGNGYVALFLPMARAMRHASRILPSPLPRSDNSTKPTGTIGISRCLRMPGSRSTFCRCIIITPPDLFPLLSRTIRWRCTRLSWLSRTRLNNACARQSRWWTATPEDERRSCYRSMSGTSGIGITRYRRKSPSDPW